MNGSTVYMYTTFDQLVRMWNNLGKNKNKQSILNINKSPI